MNNVMHMGTKPKDFLTNSVIREFLITVLADARAVYEKAGATGFTPSVGDWSQYVFLARHYDIEVPKTRNNQEWTYDFLSAEELATYARQVLTEFQERAEAQAWSPKDDCSAFQALVHYFGAKELM